MIYLEACGMEYLHKNNWFHRDLEPGNIMRHIKDDVSIVHKIGDFGSAGTKLIERECCVQISIIKPNRIIRMACGIEFCGVKIITRL